MAGLQPTSRRPCWFTRTKPFSLRWELNSFFKQIGGEKLVVSYPALRTSALNGHLIITDSFLCSWGKKAFTFSLNVSRLIRYTVRYILCVHPVNTDAFYGPISVCINVIWLYCFVNHYGPLVTWLQTKNRITAFVSQTFRFTVKPVAAPRNVDCFLGLPAISVGKAPVCFTSDGVLEMACFTYFPFTGENAGLDGA